jgi:hypothetical protein
MKDYLAIRAEQERRSRGPLRLRVLEGSRRETRTPGTQTVLGLIGSPIPVVYRTRITAFESKP